VQVNFKNKQQGDIFGYLCKSSKIAKLFTFIMTTISFKEKSHSDLFSVENTQWVRKEALLTKFRYFD